KHHFLRIAVHNAADEFSGNFCEYFLSVLTALLGQNRSNAFCLCAVLERLIPEVHSTPYAHCQAVCLMQMRMAGFCGNCQRKIIFGDGLCRAAIETNQWIAYAFADLLILGRYGARFQPTTYA